MAENSSAMIQTVISRLFESFEPHIQNLFQDSTNVLSLNQANPKFFNDDYLHSFPRKVEFYSSMIQILLNLIEKRSSSYLDNLLNIFFDLIENRTCEILKHITIAYSNIDGCNNIFCFNLLVIFISDLISQILVKFQSFEFPSNIFAKLILCASKLCQSSIYTPSTKAYSMIFCQWSVILSIISESHFSALLNEFEQYFKSNDHLSQAFLLFQFVRLDLNGELSSHFLSLIVQIIQNTKSLNNSILKSISGFIKTSPLSCLDQMNSIFDIIWAIKDLPHLEIGSSFLIGSLLPKLPNRDDKFMEFYHNRIFSDASDSTKVKMLTFLFSYYLLGDKFDPKSLFWEWGVYRRVPYLSFIQCGAKTYPNQIISVKNETVNQHIIEFVELFFNKADFSVYPKGFACILVFLASIAFFDFVDYLLPKFLELDSNDSRFLSILMIIPQVNSTDFARYSTAAISEVLLKKFNLLMKKKILSSFSMLQIDDTKQAISITDNDSTFMAAVEENDQLIAATLKMWKVSKFNEVTVQHLKSIKTIKEVLLEVELLRAFPYIIDWDYEDDSLNNSLYLTLLNLSLSLNTSIANEAITICRRLATSHCCFIRFLVDHLIENPPTSEGIFISMSLLCESVKNQLFQKHRCEQNNLSSNDLLYDIELVATIGLTSYHPVTRHISKTILYTINTLLDHNGVYHYINSQISIIENIVKDRIFSHSVLDKPLQPSKLLPLGIISLGTALCSHYYDIWSLFLSEMIDVVIEAHYQPLITRFRSERLIIYIEERIPLVSAMILSSHFSQDLLNMTNRKYYCKNVIYHKMSEEIDKTSPVDNSNENDLIDERGFMPSITGNSQSKSTPSSPYLSSSSRKLEIPMPIMPHFRFSSSVVSIVSKTIKTFLNGSDPNLVFSIILYSNLTLYPVMFDILTTNIFGRETETQNKKISSLFSQPLFETNKNFKNSLLIKEAANTISVAIGDSSITPHFMRLHLIGHVLNFISSLQEFLTNTLNINGPRMITWTNDYEERVFSYIDLARDYCLIISQLFSSIISCQSNRRHHRTLKHRIASPTTMIFTSRRSSVNDDGFSHNINVLNNSSQSCKQKTDESSSKENKSEAVETSNKEKAFDFALSSESDDDYSYYSDSDDDKNSDFDCKEPISSESPSDQFNHQNRLENEWPISARHMVFRFLINWSTTTSPKLKMLREHSATALSIIVKVGPLLTDSLLFDSSSLKLFTSFEQNGINILGPLLFNHVDLLMDTYIEACYKESRNSADLYFEAFCTTFAKIEKKYTETNDNYVTNNSFPNIQFLNVPAIFSPKVTIRLSKFINSTLSLNDFNYIFREMIGNLLLLGLIYSRMNHPHCISFLESLIKIITVSIYKRFTYLFSNNYIRMYEEIMSSFDTLIKNVHIVFSFATEVVIDAAFSVLSLKNLSIPSKEIIEVIRPWVSNLRLLPKQINCFPGLSSEFERFMPYQFLETLMKTTEAIDDENFVNISNLWTELLKSPDHSELIPAYIFNWPNPETKKKLLLQLIKTDTSHIVTRLALYCSFAFSYYQITTVEQENLIHLDHWFLPIITDAFKSENEELFQYLPIVVHFAILFNDIIPEAHELFEVLCNKFSINLNYSSNGASFQELTDDILIYAVQEFVVILSQSSDDGLENWGKEALKWLFGCQSLRIARLSLTIFNQILTPIEPIVITGVCKSVTFHIINSTNDIKGITELVKQAFIFYSTVFESNGEFAFQFASCFLDCKIFVDMSLKSAGQIFVKSLSSQETNSKAWPMIIPIVRPMLNKLEKDQINQKIVNLLIQTSRNNELMLIVAPIKIINPDLFPSFIYNDFEDLLQSASDIELCKSLVHYATMIETASTKLLNAIYQISTMIVQTVKKNDNNSTSLVKIYKSALKNLTICEYAIEFITIIAKTGPSLAYQSEYEFSDWNRSIEDVIRSLGRLIISDNTKVPITDCSTLQSVVNLLNCDTIPKILPFSAQKEMLEGMIRMKRIGPKRTQKRNWQLASPRSSSSSPQHRNAQSLINKESMMFRTVNQINQETQLMNDISWDFEPLFTPTELFINSNEFDTDWTSDYSISSQEFALLESPN